MREYHWNEAVARTLIPSLPTTRVNKEKKTRPQHTALTGAEKILYLASIVLCVALSLIVITRYAQITELNMSLRKLEMETREAGKINLQLEMEKSKLRSVENIREFAEKKGLELSTPKMIPATDP